MLQPADPWLAAAPGPTTLGAAVLAALAALAALLGAAVLAALMVAALHATFLRVALLHVLSFSFHPRLPFLQLNCPPRASSQRSATACRPRRTSFPPDLVNRCSRHRASGTNSAALGQTGTVQGMT